MLLLAALLTFFSPARLWAEPPDEATHVTAEEQRSSDELVLPPDHIIEVMVDGIPLRMLVSAEASGPAQINPQVVLARKWRARFQVTWDYGEDDDDIVDSVGVQRMVYFGDRKRFMPIIWSLGEASPIADGVIGVHQLPYNRVVFPLGPPTGEQTIQTFPLIRIYGAGLYTLGTQFDLEGRKMKAWFALEREENVLTAPTANFIATRFDGGFVPGSEGFVTLDFSVQRRARTMRLARPIMLGDIPLDTFAVRYEDYGRARHVGEIAPDDPRFNPEEIVVAERKQRGQIDLLSRLGRAAVAHCSSMTYDKTAREIRLSCGPLSE